MLAWNNHPLSSEGNLTPIQLWTIGLVRNNQDPYVIEVYLFTVSIIYIHCICIYYCNICRILTTMGIDWNGPLSVEEESDESVVVPECECPLNDAQLDELATHVSPLTSSGNYGVDLFQQVIQFVTTHD